MPEGAGRIQSVSSNSLTYLPIPSYAYHMLVTRSAAGGAAVPQADDMVTALYGSQYRSLVRLAVLLGGEDVRAAEEIAQASFVALHGAWPRLRDHKAAVAFLRRAVVSRSRQPDRPDTRDDDRYHCHHARARWAGRPTDHDRRPRAALPPAGGRGAAAVPEPARPPGRRGHGRHAGRAARPHRARHDRAAPGPLARLTSGQPEALGQHRGLVVN